MGGVSSQLSLGTINPSQEVARQKLVTCRNKFLFALYKYLIDPTAQEKKVKVLNFAKDFGDVSGEPTLTDQIKITLPLLIRDNELAWLYLLCFIGRRSDIFEQFKNISPFAEKMLGKICFYHTNSPSPGCVDVQSLPDIDCVWPLSSQSSEICRKISSLVVIFPRSAVISVYDLG